MKRLISGPQPPVGRQPGEDGVDQALAAGVGRLLPHPADGRRGAPELRTIDGTSSPTCWTSLWPGPRVNRHGKVDREAAEWLPPPNRC